MPGANEAAAAVGASYLKLLTDYLTSCQGRVYGFGSSPPQCSRYQAASWG